jgi:hypothetical protein
VIFGVIAALAVYSMSLHAAVAVVVGIGAVALIVVIVLVAERLKARQRIEDAAPVELSWRKLR